MMIAAVEQIGCRYMFVFIKKNPKRAYINVIQEGRIYPFVIVAIDRIDNIAKAVNSRIIAAIFLKQTFHPHKSAPDSP